MATHLQTVSIEVRDGSRIIRIPAEFGHVGDRLNISQDEAGRLIIEPVRHPNKGLIELLDSWGPLPEDETFPEIHDPPPEPVDL